MAWLGRAASLIYSMVVEWLCLERKGKMLLMMLQHHMVVVVAIIGVSCGMMFLRIPFLNANSGNSRFGIQSASHSFRRPLGLIGCCTF